MTPPFTVLAEPHRRAILDLLLEEERSVGDLVEGFGELAPGDVVARRGSEELRPGTRVNARVGTPDAGARP